MNYYSFHVGDYAARTRYLSPMEDLAYRRLLDLYYTLEGPIPALDPAREIGMAEYALDVTAVLRKFFVEIDGAWHNTRCNEEIAAYQAMAEGGRRGAAKRWGKGGDSPPITPPMPTNNQEPITKKEKSAPAAPVVGLEEIPESLLAEWKGVRSAKRAGKITQTVVDALTREAGKAGLSVEAAIRKCVERGWQGFEADWLKDAKTLAADVARSTVPARPTNGYLSQDHRLTPEEKAAADIVRRQVMASIKTIGKAA